MLEKMPHRQSLFRRNNVKLAEEAVTTGLNTQYKRDFAESLSSHFPHEVARPPIKGTRASQDLS